VCAAGKAGPPAFGRVGVRTTGCQDPTQFRKPTTGYGLPKRPRYQAKLHPPNSGDCGQRFYLRSVRTHVTLQKKWVRAIPQLAGIAHAIRASATEPPSATHHALHLGKSPVARDPVIGTIRFTSTSEGRHRHLDRRRLLGRPADCYGELLNEGSNSPRSVASTRLNPGIPVMLMSLWT
jgi:hypothetical protein